MFKKNIRSRVLEAVEKKISEGQAEYNTRLTQLKDNFKKAQEEMKIEHENDCVQLENNIVNNILSKIL